MAEKKYSIIIPVYNEEAIIKQLVKDLLLFLDNKLKDYEIIVVDDGSKDKSWEKLSQISHPNLKLVRHPYNKGYGSALKTGASKARADVLIFYDGDNQHKPEDILKLVSEIGQYDMVVGSREGYKGPAWRQPGKKIINLIANYLVNFKIPDLNSGLRAVKKEKFNRFRHLYPNGFSLSTTITLAFLKQGYSVGYVPIQINKREGKSTVHILDGFRAVNLVLKMIMLFSPLKIFIPVSLLFFIIGAISLCRDVFIVFNLNDNTILLLISALLFFLFGLLADQIAAIRREIRIN